MIKSKELRIGNYLLDSKNRICKVEEIKLNGFNAPAIEGAITSLPHKPIQLKSK